MCYGFKDLLEYKIQRLLPLEMDFSEKRKVIWYQIKI